MRAVIVYVIARLFCQYQTPQQGRSETPPNQVFERVTFITIVNPFDIFGKFFDDNFFILENVMPQMPLSVIYQTSASSFSEQDVRNGKKAPVRDLCGSEPGYLTLERDNSYVRYLGDLVSTFCRGLSESNPANLQWSSQ